MRTQAEKADVLSRVPLFTRLSKRQLNQLAKQARDVRFGAGQEIAVEDEPGAEMLVILHGTVKVSRRNRRIATLGRGDVVGELALIDRRPRSATVTAETEIEGLEIDRPDFVRLLESAPAVAVRLLETLALRLRDANRELASRN